ncbi:uncharacterized protein JCM15063_004393 [Sporobolomyces koalae]|uniref:uncharacterized protein n=1 Tax=Sporobolomyces koalae TaxID=500713 RepID=UPI003180E215
MRSRPEPLALHHSNSAPGPGDNLSYQERARLLSSLRSAPAPSHQFHSQNAHATGAPQTFDPRSEALAQFQSAQTAYLAELQRQIVAKQNEIWINQQQIQAEAALRALKLQQHQLQHHQQFEADRETEWNLGMQRELEQQQARTNPLVASALARRKRQSLNVSAPAHERQSTPPGVTATRAPSPPSSASSSSRRSTPPPPAVILSAPGEPYPDTSSASGSDSGETRPSTPSTDSASASPRLDSDPVPSTVDASPVIASPPSYADELDREMKASRRRSHLDTLSNALGARQKRRPASIGGSPSAGIPLSSFTTTSPSLHDLATPKPHQLSFPLSPLHRSSPRSSPRISGAHPTTPRSVSDSQALLRSPGLGSMLTASPGTYSPGARFDSQHGMTLSGHVSVKPATLPGHAFVVRQPKGPPTNLDGAAGDNNFGHRIRQKAIESLALRSSLRHSTH